MESFKLKKTGVTFAYLSQQGNKTLSEMCPCSECVCDCQGAADFSCFGSTLVFEKILFLVLEFLYQLPTSQGFPASSSRCYLFSLALLFTTSECFSPS